MGVLCVRKRPRSWMAGRTRDLEEMAVHPACPPGALYWQINLRPSWLRRIVASDWKQPKCPSNEEWITVTYLYSGLLFSNKGEGINTTVSQIIVSRTRLTQECILYMEFKNRLKNWYLMIKLSLQTVKPVSIELWFLYQVTPKFRIKEEIPG